MGPARVSVLPASRLLVSVRLPADCVNEPVSVIEFEPVNATAVFKETALATAFGPVRSADARIVLAAFVAERRRGPVPRLLPLPSTSVPPIPPNPKSKPP